METVTLDLRVLGVIIAFLLGLGGIAIAFTGIIIGRQEKAGAMLIAAVLASVSIISAAVLIGVLLQQ